MKVFLVEDERNLNELLRAYLENEGFSVISYTSGEEAMENIAIEADIYVLDIMLDSVNGFDLLKKIREYNTSSIIIFISARDSDIDRVLGLENGCDDYITKPFSPKELVIRIKNILSRKTINTEFINYDSYRIDIARRVVYNSDEIVNLTTKEFDLVLLFVQNPRKAFSREEILKNVWDDDYFGSDRAVDDLVRRMRSKLPYLRVETIYGYGYRLL